MMMDVAIEVEAGARTPRGNSLNRGVGRGGCEAQLTNSALKGIIRLSPAHVCLHF